jgi:WD40 repeat protein
LKLKFAVVILHLLGLQVREFRHVHTATVNEVSIDSDGEFVGSCSDDGTVVISSLYTDEKEKFEYHRPMKAVALDPEYSRKKSRQFAAGGLAGQLLFISKGWFGHREQVICVCFYTLEYVPTNKIHKSLDLLKMESNCVMMQSCIGCARCCIQEKELCMW